MSNGSFLTAFPRESLSWLDYCPVSWLRVGNKPQANFNDRLLLAERLFGVCMCVCVFV